MEQTPLEADSPAGQPARIVLRYWASLRAAAGVTEDVVEADHPMSLRDLADLARARHDSVRFRDVLSTCSVLVGDRPAASDDPSSVMVRPGESVEFLPPFAGG